MARLERHRGTIGLIFILSLNAALFACADERGSGSSSDQASVRGIASQLDEAGIGCVDLVVHKPPKNQSSGESATPPEGAIGLPPRYAGPVASETGFCVLKGAPLAQGRPLASMILVFEDDEHLDRLPSGEILEGGGPIPRQALVYGDTWEMFVIPDQFAEDIADALGGKVRTADA